MGEGRFRYLFEKWSLLAGIRFGLASIVFLTHLNTFAPSLPIIKFLGSAAFEAITGFLLLSGYSIGCSYTSRRDGFYLRRAERIYPAYLGAVGLALAGSGWPGLFVLVANLLFLNQLLTTQSFVGPAWSLALEVWLYALTPLLARASGRTLWIVTAVSFAAYLIYVPSITLLRLPYFTGLGYGGILVTLSFFWLLGFILATQPNAKRTCLIIALVMCATLGLSFLITAVHSLKHNIVPAFVATDLPQFVWRAFVLSAVWAALWLAISDRLPREKSRWLAWLGDLSYPLYVVHIPIFVLALSWGATNTAVLAALAFAGAAAVMIVLEYPVRLLRTKSRPSAIVGKAS